MEQLKPAVPAGQSAEPFSAPTVLTAMATAIVPGPATALSAAEIAVPLPAVPLRALIAEDSEGDAGLIRLELEAGGYAVHHHRVCTAEAMARALAAETWDIVLCDYAMPTFTGLQAIQVLQAAGMDIPLLIISGTVDETTAVDAMRAGARDYLLKSNLQRLVPAVQRELREAADRRKARAASEQLRMLERALECTLDPVLIFDHRQDERPVVYVNRAFERQTGYQKEEVIGKSVGFLYRDDLAQPEIEMIAQAAREEREIAVTVRNYRKDGSPYWNEVHLAPVRNGSGQVTHYIGVQNDISDRRGHEAELLHLANHDRLTGLPNRNLLKHLLHRDLVHAGRKGRSVALLSMDVRGIGDVNENFGYETGDAVLRSVAELLTRQVRESDTVARVDGYRFVICLADLEKDAMIAELSQRLVVAVSEPILLNEQVHLLSASIGIAVFPQDGTDADTLLKHSNSALSLARQEGSGALQFFTQDLGEKQSRRATLARQLRQAFEQQDLFVEYQPQVDLRTGAVIGFEALLRWRHAESGSISPAEFVPIAEDLGLIVPIGLWVIEVACRQLRAWKDAGFGDLRMAINLAPQQVRQPELVQMLTNIIAKCDVDPSQIELELTESTLLATEERNMEQIRALRKLGFEFAIDDFGTGYCNFSYLRQFPVDCVKIDQSFVRGITTSPTDASICASITSIAHALKMRVVAEGVETKAELAAIQGYGCDQIQGYLFSRSLGATEATELLREGRKLALEQDSDTRVRTLLLVDDEPNVALALNRALRRDGYRILIANGAEQGFELLARNRVGVIISDQRMPGMNGTEFLHRVKDLYPKTVRMVLSGYTDLQSVTDAINKGDIYKFLTKPWEDNDLREVLREAFARQELASENVRLSAELGAANQRLEAALAEKSDQLNQGEKLLDVAYEALAVIPVAVLGIDPAGMIALSNAASDALLGGGAPLVGGFAEDRLPQALLVQLAGEDADASLVARIGDADYLLLRHALGSASAGKGTLLTLLRKSGP